MAFVKASVSGSFRGKTGDKIYRKVNGRIVVSQTPVFINVSQTIGCLNSRFRFKIVEDLAKTIKTDDLLYGLWDKVKPVGANKFSRIIKANLSRAKYKGLNSSNVITPRPETVPSRFRKNCVLLGKKSIGMNNDCVYAEVKFDHFCCDVLRPPYVAYFLVFLGKQASDEELPKYEFLAFNCYVADKSEEEIQRYEIVFDDETKNIIRKYTYSTVLFAIVKINDKNNIYEWSRTEAVEVLL